MDLNDQELRLGYVGITTQTLDRWAAFAVDVLGGECAVDGDELRIRLDDHWCRMFIRHEENAAEDLVFAGWETASHEQFDAVVDRVRAASVDVHVADPGLCGRRGVMGLAYFDDCDGLRTEVYWGPYVHSAPWRPGRRHWGYVTGHLGLGHLVLRSDDRAASEAFYRDVLGFVVSDYGSGPLVFMASNERHHSVAFLPSELESRGKRLVHLMLQVKELDDVGVAFDACLNGAAPILQVLGRHSNDLAFSFYVLTPSGVEIEYGWGARTRGERWVNQRYLDRDVWGHQPAASFVELLSKQNEKGQR